MMLQAPSYDTVGWFARDAQMFARVGEVLLESGNRRQLPRRMLVARDAFELADPAVVSALQPVVDTAGAMIGDVSNERLSPNGLVEWHNQQLILQSREAWESVADWIDHVNPRMSFLVAKRYVFASEITETDIEDARVARETIRIRMDEVLLDDVIVCLPTTASPARQLHEPLSVRQVVQEATYSLVTVASTIGAPQINLPLAEVDGLPVGLSLIGPRGSDDTLMELGLELESHIANQTSSR
jgi:amidase